MSFFLTLSNMRGIIILDFEEIDEKDARRPTP